MKAILFGTTGMVGQGVLRECLLSQDVDMVLSVGRRLTGRHPKLRQVAHQDFTDFTAIERELSGYDACVFCLGVSSVGMSEGDYRQVTYEFTLAAAQTPLYPLWKALFPKYVTTTAQIGRAMIHVAKAGAPKRVLENRDINQICSSES